MDPQAPGRRVDRFLIFRLAVIPAAFALVALCRGALSLSLGDRALWILSVLLGAYTVLVLAPFAAPAWLRVRRTFILAQVSVDFLAAGILIWMTGGVESIFCPFLFATLFNASTVLRGKETLTFAACSTAFLAASAIGYRIGDPPLIPPWPDRPADFAPPAVAARLVALGLALHAVALLGTRLSRGLHSMQSIQEEILENMAEGLVAVGGEGNVLQMNGEAKRIFGLPADASVSGLGIADVFPGAAMRPVREAFEGIGRKRFEFVRHLDDGRAIPVEAKISSTPEGGDRPRCRIGLFGDLSLKKEIEEAERRIHRLEELYNMAMAIAHEIRNPLASIRGCVQEIGRARDRNPMEGKLVDIVCRESDRLDRIIEEFMTNARSGPLSLRPVDLVGLLEDIVLQLRNHQKIGSRRIRIASAPKAAMISGDERKLRQVFLNLGTNAIEATGESGEIVISLRSREFMALNRRRAGERRMVPGIEIEYSDDGTGMSPEVEKMAFTPFFSTKEKGHGIGLAVVYSIVRDHLGKVDVESESGKGSRFRVWFPLLTKNAGSSEAEGRSRVREAVHV